LARFFPLSEDEIARFIKETKTKNTVRKTSQDFSLLKAFLRQKKSQKLEEEEAQELGACLQKFILSLRKKVLELVVNHHLYLLQASKDI